MNTKKALDLIKNDLLGEMECVECQIGELIETLEMMEEELDNIMKKVNALDEIEKFIRLKVVK